MSFDPCGQMDKASVSGAEDCGFESRQGWKASGKCPFFVIFCSEFEGDQITKLRDSGKCMILNGKHELLRDDVKIKWNFAGDSKKYGSATSDTQNILCVIDCELDKELKEEGATREVCRKIQDLRKTVRKTFFRVKRLNIVEFDSNL